MTSLRGQQPLFKTVEIGTVRVDALYATEALLLQLIPPWVGNDGRCARPMTLALGRAIAAGCRSWEDVVAHVRKQKISKLTRARVLAWITNVARVGIDEAHS